jgi:proline iminopeptidase
VAETYVEHRGARLWTDAQGTGVPLLLCNGGPGAADYLGPVAELLAAAARTVRFEQRGCGRSSPEGPYDLATTLSDLEAIRGAYGIERWIAGGHSWGANLALAYTLEYPQHTRALIYLCGNGAQHDVDWRAQYKRARAAQGERAPETGFPGNDRVNREGNHAWYDYIKQPDFFRRVAQIDVPVLFVFAADDVRPAWPAQQLAALIAGAEEIVIEGAAHYIWLTQPEALRAALHGFLERVRPGG